MGDFFEKTKDLYEKKEDQKPLVQRPRSRPLGLTILIIAATVYAFLALLLAIAAFIIGASGNTQQSVGLTMGGIIFGITPVLLLVFAYGAWKLKGWARWLGIFIFGYEAVFAILRLSAGSASVIDAAQIVIGIAVIIYLLRPSVRDSFSSIEPAGD